MFFLSSVCYTCLVGKDNLKNLNDFDDDNVRLMDKLIFCALENEFVDSDIPIFICEECCVTLDTSFKFKNLCVTSNKKIHDYLAHLNDYEKQLGRETDDDESGSHLAGSAESILFQDSNTSEKQEIERIKIKQEFVIDKTEDITEQRTNDTYNAVKNEEFIIESEYNEQEPETLEIQIDESKNNETDEEGITPDKRYIEEGDLTCPVCSKTFKSTKNLKIHVVWHKKRKQLNEAGEVNCPICDKKFQNSNNLKHHVVWHSKVTSYRCGECQESFPTLAEVRLHKQTHLTERRHCCSICNKAFRTKGVLTTHVRRMHDSEEERPFSCHICDRRFSIKYDLDHHIFMHTSERPFHCEQCDKTFARKFCLAQHQLVHTDIKMYACHLCDRKLRSKDGLRKHIMTHTGVKLFSCSVCAKKFRGNPELKIHMLIHTGERPHECPFCQRRFKQRIHMRKHVWTMHPSKKYL